MQQYKQFKLLKILHLNDCFTREAQHREQVNAIQLFTPLFMLVGAGTNRRGQWRPIFLNMASQFTSDR